MAFDKKLRDSKTLRRWFVRHAAIPIYFSLVFVLAIQMAFIFSRVSTKRDELKETAKNLSNVLGVGLFQKNRILIETSSSYALSTSEIAQICIFDENKLVFSMPISGNPACILESKIFFEKMNLKLKNMPQYNVSFFLPKYPGLSSNALIFLVSSVLVLPIFLVLFSLLKKIESDLIAPLRISISKLDVVEVGKSKNDHFTISELGQLMKSYQSKLVEIKELTDKEAAISKDAAVGRVIANLAHDLRAPLGIIEKLVHASEPDLDDVKRQVKVSLARLYSMIEALRYSEVENLIHRTDEKFDLEFLFDNMKSKAEIRGIMFKVPDIEAINVSIDHAKITRSCINLVSNAIDFAKTEVRIEAKNTGSELIFAVVDDGPGVPDEFLLKLFQRGATHGKHDGSGLGLAYVRQIMRGHGGDVIYRRENDLTTFECRLPNAVLENQEDAILRKSLAIAKDRDLIKRVGLCFVPKSMAESLCAKLAFFKSEKFSFSTEYDGADFVATNDPDLALTAVEEGKHPLEFKAKLAEAVVLDGLKRRFNLV